TTLDSDHGRVLDSTGLPTQGAEELIPQHGINTAARVVVTRDLHRSQRGAQRQAGGDQRLAEPEVAAVAGVSNRVLQRKRGREIVLQLYGPHVGTGLQKVVAESVVVIPRHRRRQRAEIRDAVVWNIVVVLMEVDEGQTSRSSETQRQTRRDAITGRDHVVTVSHLSLMSHEVDSEGCPLA